jgi:hypothetical protein
MNAPGSSPQYGKGTPLKANLSHESSDGLNIMGSLREEQEEKQRLEKQCFDLKMRVSMMGIWMPITDADLLCPCFSLYRPHRSTTSRRV